MDHYTTEDPFNNPQHEVEIENVREESLRETLTNEANAN